MPVVCGGRLVTLTHVGHVDESLCIDQNNMYHLAHAFPVLRQFTVCCYHSHRPPQMYGSMLPTPPPDTPQGALPPFAAPLLDAYAAHLHGEVPMLLAEVVGTLTGDRDPAAGQCVHAVVQASQPLFAAGAGATLTTCLGVRTAAFFFDRLLGDTSDRTCRFGRSTTWSTSWSTKRLSTAFSRLQTSPQCIFCIRHTVHTHTHPYTHIHTRTHTYTPAHTHTHPHTHIHTRTCPQPHQGCSRSMAPLPLAWCGFYRPGRCTPPVPSSPLAPCSMPFPGQLQHCGNVTETWSKPPACFSHSSVRLRRQCQLECPPY